MKDTNFYFKSFLTFLAIYFGFTCLVQANNPGYFDYSIGIRGDQEDPYLAFAEQMPEPVGGLPAIYKKIVYPSIAKSAGLEGKVYLLIFVNENGNVDDVKVIKDVGGGCGDAAVNAVKSVKYTPGKNGGAAVKVKLSLAINFKLK